MKRLLIGLMALAALTACSSNTAVQPMPSATTSSTPSFAYVVTISDGSQASIQASATAVALGNNKWGTDSKPIVEVTGSAAQCHILHNDVVVNMETRTSANQVTCYIP